MTDLTRSSQVYEVDPSAVADRLEAESPAPVEFHTVFQFHSPYVWHTLRRLGIAPSDLEDPTRPIRPWLFAFAFRKASAYRRSGQHRFEVVGDERETVDPHPSALDALLRKEAVDLGHAALGELELHQRAVFVLHELDGCPMPEVARTLELPLNTAYSRLRLGRAAFEKAVRRLRAQRGEP